MARRKQRTWQERADPPSARAAAPQRAPQPEARPGNRAIARLLATNGGAAQDAAQRETIRRVIQLDGKEQDLGALFQGAKDLDELVVLANWGWSDVVHNFVSTKRTTAAKSLQSAIKAAKSQVEEPPALFTAANLRFLTDAGDRLPTLYFVSGVTSGRIRQQHGAGPAVIVQSNKVDYFFPRQSYVRAFGEVAGEAKQLDEDFEPDVADFGGTLTPTDGYFHYEVTYTGKKVAKTHPSGGKCVTDTKGWDDTKIRTAYQRAIGRAM